MPITKQPSQVVLWIQRNAETKDKRKLKLVQEYIYWSVNTEICKAQVRSAEGRIKSFLKARAKS